MAAVAAAALGLAAAAFPPEALPPADFHPSSPALEAEVGAVVDAGDGVTGTGGGAFAPPLPLLPLAADPDAGGGVAGGTPPPLPPPLKVKKCKVEKYGEKRRTEEPNGEECQRVCLKRKQCKYRIRYQELLASLPQPARVKSVSQPR